MKSFVKFLLIGAAILLISALAAPLLYKILPFKFERIFRRLVMIGALAVVFWAVWKKQIRFPLESVWPLNGAGNLALAGFIGGFLTLVLLTAVKGALGVLTWSPVDQGIGAWTVRVLMSLGAALLIGVIEEIFFRGVVFTSIREKWRWGLYPSLIATNFFYAIVHYLGGKKPYIGPDPDFFDSVKLILAPLQSYLDWAHVLPGAVGLFIFGWVLSLLFLRTGSLYPSIGIHAGCVFFLKMIGAFSFHEVSNPAWFGTSKGYDGVLGWGFLVLLGVSVMKLFNKNPGRMAAFGLVLVLTASVSSCPPVMAADSWETFDGGASGAEKSEPKEVASRTTSPLSPAEPDPMSVSAPTSSSSVRTSSTGASGLSALTGASMPSRKIMSVSASGLESSTQGGGSLTSGDQAVPESQSAEAVALREKADDAVQKMIAEVERIPASLEPESKQGPVAAPYVSTSKNRTMETQPAMKQVLNQKAETEAVHQAVLEDSGAVMPRPATTVKRADLAQKTGSLSSEERVNSAESAKPATKGILKTSTKAPEKLFEDDGAGEEKPLVSGSAKAATKHLAKAKAGSSAGSYSFMEHFPEAEAVNIKDQVEIFPGTWKDDGFYFPESTESSAVKIRELSFEGTLQKGIYVEPVVDTLRRVRFFDVPPGRKLIFSYGIADDGFIQNAKSTVYVRIWAGSHLLKRVRVLNERGWKKEEIDLGVLAFLRMPVSITFDVTADDVTRRYFSFYAEIR